MAENIALMYLAEQTSPSDYKMENVNVVEKMGAVFASFDAVLHSFDVLNRNRRMYDGDNVWNMIQTNERIQDGIRKHGWYGECDHPGQDFQNMALTAERVQKILMPNRSHVIVEPYRKGNLLCSRIETCAGTDAGVGMCRDIIQGLVPSFSCRSIAAMQYRNGKPYVNVKKVITYDWVLYPSHREAEMQGKASVSNGVQKILLESANGDSITPAFFNNYSKDMAVPVSQFTDFKESMLENDKNVNVVLESGDYSTEDIKGFDPVTGNCIIESEGNTLFVNTSLATKKKIEDFLLSF